MKIIKIINKESSIKTTILDTKIDYISISKTLILLKVLLKKYKIFIRLINEVIKKTSIKLVILKSEIKEFLIYNIKILIIKKKKLIIII